MKRLLALLALTIALTACQGGQDNNQNTYPTLPEPVVRVEKMPTATLTSTPQPATAEPTTPTPNAEIQVQQVWPTLDEEEYWISQIDTLFAKIEQELNSVDTRLKP